MRFCFKKLFSYKKPIIKENTFLIWEPCSHSHAEVVPGFAKYLLDLGYHVSILINPKRYKEGLFCRFNHPNISYNKLSKRQIYKYFKKDSLEDVKGVLITTIGKLYDGKDLNQVYKLFHNNVNKNKLLFVEHDIASYINNNQKHRKDLITLREMDYKNAITVPVNPHYFGNIKITNKNKLTTFITIGALSEKRKNTTIIINAVNELINKGVQNFKVIVIGKGNIKNLSPKIQNFFEIKGRLSFDKMYTEIENADFILSAYENNEEHIKYITAKTSGTFQLVYGFVKPIIINEKFAPINGLNSQNAILYSQNAQYSDAMLKAINMYDKEYQQIQQNLKSYANKLYNISKSNLENLIKGYE